MVVRNILHIAYLPVELHTISQVLVLYLLRIRSRIVEDQPMG